MLRNALTFEWRSFPRTNPCGDDMIKLNKILTFCCRFTASTKWRRCRGLVLISNCIAIVFVVVSFVNILHIVQFMCIVVFVFHTCYVFDYVYSSVCKYMLLKLFKCCCAFSCFRNVCSSVWLGDCFRSRVEEKLQVTGGSFQLCTIKASSLRRKTSACWEAPQRLCILLILERKPLD